MRRSKLPIFILSLISLCLALSWLGAPEGVRQSTESASAAESLEVSSGDGLPLGAVSVERSEGAESPGSGAPAYALGVGSLVEHAFSMELTQTMSTTEDAAPTVMTYRFSGAARTSVLAAEGERMLVSQKWPDASVEAVILGQAVDPEFLKGMRRSMELGLVLEQGRDGVVESISFPDGCTSEERMLLRTILAATRIVVPEGAESGRSWTVEEQDADGLFEAEYRQLGESAGLEDISKTFLSRTDELTVDAKRSDVGSGTASFADGWLARMEWTASTEIRIPVAGLHLSGTLHASLEPVGRGICAHEVFDELFAALEWSPVGSMSEMAALEASSRESILRSKIEGETLQGLLQEIMAILDAGLHDSAELFDARNRLAILLEFEPEALGELALLIAANTLGPGVFEVVVGAIGLAGTPPAQMLLCELASSLDRGTTDRLSAMISMFQVGKPLPELLDTARFLALGGEQDREVSDTSLLLLGHLGQSDQGAVLRSELASLGEAMVSAGRGRTWLESLGNLGPHTPHEAALPYLSSTDSALRTSAVNALRGSNAPEALHGLWSAAASDTSTSVRCAAVEVLAGRADVESVGVVKQVLASDPDSKVRKAALMGLVERKDSDAGAYAMMQSVADSDPDPDLALLAYNILNEIEPEV